MHRRKAQQDLQQVQYTDTIKTETFRFLHKKDRLGSPETISQKFIKAIDKYSKVGYTNNVGATDDGCFPKQLKDNR